MPLFAKVLAVFIVLTAGGFIYLLSVDYQARQQWSYEVFRHELVLNGLPVDEYDVGLKVDQQPTYDAKSKTWRLPDEDKDAAVRIDRPLYTDLGPDMLFDLFNDSFALGKDGKDGVVKTQKEEVERVRDKLKAELDAAKNDAERRSKLKAFFLARYRCARTVKEREDSLKLAKDDKIKIDELEKEFLARFNAVVAPDASDDVKRSVAERRADVANLLYSIDTRGESHQRLMVVVGLRAFAMEADLQTLTLRDIAERTAQASKDDREEFAAAYAQQTDRVHALALALSQRQKELETQEQNVKSQSDQIDKRIEDIKNLKAEVDVLKKNTQASLDEQNKLENQLFEIHKKTGNLIEENRKLERDIRNLELGRSRGGSR
jgi:hypothetical protein